LATIGEVAVSGTPPVSDGLHFVLLSDIVGRNREPSWAGPFCLWIGLEGEKIVFSFFSENLNSAVICIDLRKIIRANNLMKIFVYAFYDALYLEKL
jgi:hypothetical protein